MKSKKNMPQFIGHVVSNLPTSPIEKDMCTTMDTFNWLGPFMDGYWLLYTTAIIFSITYLHTHIFINYE